MGMIVVTWLCFERVYGGYTVSEFAREDGETPIPVCQDHGGIYESDNGLDPDPDNGRDRV